MTRSFTVSVGATPTPLIAPDWDAGNYGIALPAITQTTSFTVTLAMAGPMVGLVPYNSASAGTATIPQNLTADIGANLLFGQVGAGNLTVAPGTGVTIIGQPTTLGPNHVLIMTQTALNVWTGMTYSWNLPQFLGNPNGQPLLVSYGHIRFFNSAGASVLIDTNPNIVFGGNGILLVATGTGQGVDVNIFEKNYGNGPAELWYGIVASTPSNLTVITGPAWSAS